MLPNISDEVQPKLSLGVATVFVGLGLNAAWVGALAFGAGWIAFLY